MTFRTLRTITFFWLVWRVGLFLVAAVAPSFISYQPTFPYWQLLDLLELPHAVSAWANFDGVHYWTIAKDGYFGTGLIQAFFPLYPFLLRAVHMIVHNYIWSGILLSSFFSWLVAVLWYGYAKEIWGQKVAVLSLLALAVFPTSFYFAAIYSESLFLSLVIAAFWAGQQKKWWLVGLLAAGASATRVVGICLVPALLLLWWQNPTRRILDSLYILAGSLGLLSYMGYLHLVYHDALYFFHLQSQFGSGRQQNLVLYPQVVWRSFKIVLTYQPHDSKYLAFVQEFLTGLLVPVTIWFSRNLASLAWLLFSSCAMLFPSLTGNFSSFPRYFLVCMPYFVLVVIKLQNHRWRMVAYLLGSSALLILNTVLFIQGYWVA